MKKYIFTLILTLFALSIPKGAAQAVLKVDKTTCDLGTFPEEKPVQCEFHITNTGDQPLVIYQALASCGCTVPSFPKQAIKPNEKGVITITYNGKGKYPGHFTKVVTIRSNASNKLVRLYVKGNMSEKK